MTIPLVTVARILRQVPAAAPPQSDVDAELVRACLGGDRGAFDRLYRKHAQLVHRRLARMIGPDGELEDLVQQVFLEAFSSLPAFRGEAAFSTWLYRITANVALTALRRRARKRRVWELAEPLEELPDGEPTPEQKVRERELFRAVLHHLGRLKPDHRIAFVLRHVECLDFRSIAEIVGAREPAVRQRVKLAERKLIDRLARDERRRC